MRSGGMSRSAWFSASTLAAAIFRKSALLRSGNARWRPIARSGQSTWRMNPARWIASYSSFITSTRRAR